MNTTYAGENVTAEVADGIVHVGLNSPAEMNALTPDMVDGLCDAVEDAVRAGHRHFVFFGHGDSFCAGASMSGYQVLVESVTTTADSGIGDLIRSERRLLELARTLSAPDIFSVAAVHGWVIGHGLEIALACDFMVAEQESTFWLPETKQGWNVGMGATSILSQAVGRGWARRMLLLNDRLPAETAESLGLVARLTPKGESRDAATALLLQLRATSPMASQFQKQLLDLLPTMSLDDGRHFEILTAFFLASTVDPREAMRAFQEDRRPRYGA